MKPLSAWASGLMPAILILTLVLHRVFRLSFRSFCVKLLVGLISHVRTSPYLTKPQ